MSFVLALDQGTTSSRAIVFDRRGRALAASQQEFAQHYPRPGWVEHQPADLWSSVRRTAVGALTKARLTGKNICSLGITNQRETTLLWERATGRPLHPAIVWQDRRTADLCARLKQQGLEPFFTKRTGLVLDPYFSGTKLRWLLDNIPGARRRAEKGELAFGTVDSWLLWQLTEGRVHATDVSNASRTLLLNLHSGEWDEELLKILRIPRGVLPAVRPSSGVFGEVSAVRALRTERDAELVRKLGESSASTRDPLILERSLDEGRVEHLLIAVPSEPSRSPSAESLLRRALDTGADVTVVAPEGANLGPDGAAALLRW